MATETRAAAHAWKQRPPGTGIASDRFFPCLPMWGVIREYAFDTTNTARGLFGSDDILVCTLPAPKPGQQSYVVVVEHEGRRVLRLGGGAEVSATEPPLEAFAAILERVKGHGEPLRDWVGCRSVSPDGAPVVGLVPGSANCYMNAGQSFWGWTLSFGSARVLADHILGEWGLGGGGERRGWSCVTPESRSERKETYPGSLPA